MRKVDDMGLVEDSERQQLLAEPLLALLVPSAALVVTIQIQPVHLANRRKRAPPEVLARGRSGQEALEDSARATRPALSGKVLPRQPEDLELVLQVPLDQARREADLGQIHPEDLDPGLEQVHLEVHRNPVPSVSAEGSDRTLPTLLPEDLGHLQDQPLELLLAILLPVPSEPVRLHPQPILGAVLGRTPNLVEHLAQPQLKRTSPRSADSEPTHLIQQHLQQEDSARLVRNLQGLVGSAAGLGVAQEDLGIQIPPILWRRDCSVAMPLHLDPPPLAWVHLGVVIQTRRVASGQEAVCSISLPLPALALVEELLEVIHSQQGQGYLDPEDRVPLEVVVDSILEALRKILQAEGYLEHRRLNRIITNYSRASCHRRMVQILFFKWEVYRLMEEIHPNQLYQLRPWSPKKEKMRRTLQFSLASGLRRVEQNLDSVSVAAQVH